MKNCTLTKGVLGEIAQLSFLTCLQQSVMNFGILMVQGRVNSFGTAVMAAFAAAVKIDSFAYMPVQDFGNAFSTFIAQNYGAGKEKRISQESKSAVTAAFVFCLVISAAVCAFAAPLMGIFVNASQTEIISIGVGYLRIEGAFYFGIGLLFFDTVHRFLLRETQTSTSLIEGSFAGKSPRIGITPAVADCGYRAPLSPLRGI